MFTAIFTPAAQTELMDAQDWYVNQAAGFGRRFRVAIDGLIERMSASPRQFSGCVQGCAARSVKALPYMLFFVIEGETLYVIACFHASRSPLHWQKRV